MKLQLEEGGESSYGIIRIASQGRETLDPKPQRPVILGGMDFVNQKRQQVL